MIDIEEESDTETIQDHITDYARVKNKQSCAKLVKKTLDLFRHLQSFSRAQIDKIQPISDEKWINDDLYFSVVSDTLVRFKVFSIISLLEYEYNPQLTENPQ